MLLKKKSTIFVLDIFFMNEEYDKLVARLNENIQKLILLYSNEKEKNINLTNEVEIINNELNQNKERYREIEKKYENLKLAKTIEGTEFDNKEAKLKLNRIIREIDNCIALMNK